MLCPRCYGTHLVVVRDERVPCPECQGMGEIHCCDGLCDQPGGAEDGPDGLAGAADGPAEAGGRAAS